VGLDIRRGHSQFERAGQPGNQRRGRKKRGAGGRPFEGGFEFKGLGSEVKVGSTWRGVADAFGLI